jgi:ribosomal protein S18 acetylase RimI-like enzyme
MSSTDLVVEEITDPTADDHAALSGLLAHLSSVRPPDADELASLARASATTLLGARLDGRIVGTLSLVCFPLLTGMRAWIEDVVVEPEARGHGVATALIEEALRRAERLGCRTVDLTSRPSRVEANRLYEKLGFERRETNVYRKKLLS